MVLELSFVAMQKRFRGTCAAASLNRNAGRVFSDHHAMFPRHIVPHVCRDDAGDEVLR
jgi:hypothetical protein